MAGEKKYIVIFYFVELDNLAFTGGDNPNQQIIEFLFRSV